ncbi:unnamed protein product [Polarella glacialis]|uniref:Fatty acid desaturase domain-containing protein n=1 Tax=Polarella glacialis TaxID=89957 RepID=A0A813HLM7_POLGL|nr:unnamed protein product [Polarella glacialis]
MSESRWLRERMELAQAMKTSPSALDPAQCDYVPPLELIGIYVAHSTITRMVAQGRLDAASGAYVNAALGCHAFAILHHCTHESISQHNEEHAPFENTVFRLASMLIFFDDGYKEAHRAHHQQTNEPDDPDMILSHTSLPVLGHVLFHLQSSYVSLGAPITPFMAAVLCKLGLVRHMSKTWVMKFFGLVNWDNVVLKMAGKRALEVLAAHQDYSSLDRAVQATWLSSGHLTYILLNEVENFYDSTYRAQGPGGFVDDGRRTSSHAPCKE